ncbi:hypothetical protein NLU13_4291 [Sarocladium strictum]|uniref:Nicotinamide-nucleotide adenylyltransferase n=1 Tax=Sarocladium strictum TaxID=5046 RepID=A0AA39GL61_SARSR|nr:hypothetical protein NLU13_4291 [Sarocladium strictum]
MALTRKAMLEHFSRSLMAFQASSERFSVLYTLPWSSDAKRFPQNPRTVQDGTSDSNALEIPERLVVLDSSFNPPTRAHAAMLRSAVAASSKSIDKDEGTTRVLLLLAVRNADKAPQPAAFPSRLGMMERFGRELREWDEGTGITIDIGVTTEPYFHDKAQAIQSSGFYGNSKQPEQVFLAGFDTLVRIFDPKYYADGGGMQTALGPFFENSRLRVTLRANDDWGSADEQRAWVRSLEEEGKENIEERGGRKEWLDRIDLVDGVEGEAVSSSRVRQAVKLGRDVNGMVGEQVKRWIEEEGLYRDT